ncbi:MAG: GGDEF domain-containing protein [Lachnospiraceae bacterium]|nr:GGDEF domain-containing protein [Lachnospiraceae bacterium]
MYSEEQLKKYAYFENELKNTAIEFIRDPLTGLVSRPYILGFAKALIEEKTPFTYAMLDLDNFKFINDTYGHKAGDGVLAAVADGLIRYMDGFGIVGRFGGDELLIINLRDLAYDDKKAYLKDMYRDGVVLRKNIELKTCSPFITGTLGCASFPEDAKNYDDLFGIMDKVLYRGKVKGRNCYIIYVEEKHKDIEISRMAKKGIYGNMHNLIRQFEMVPGMKNRLYSVLPFMMEELQISDLYYISSDNVMRGVKNIFLREEVPDIGKLMTDDLYTTTVIEDVSKRSPLFFSLLEKWKIETLLVVRVGVDLDTNGYLICAEPRSHRIWQDGECALMYFLAKLIAYRIRTDGEELPTD